MLYERRRRAEDAVEMVQEFKQRGAATDDRKAQEQLAKLCRHGGIGKHKKSWRNYVGVLGRRMGDERKGMGMVGGIV